MESSLMQLLPTMVQALKGYETGAVMVNGHPKLLSHGTPALSAYQDYKGIWTIGWGHVNPKTVGPGSRITMSVAEQLLEADCAVMEHGVSHAVNGGADTNDHQFSAMVCLAYNIGPAAFATSTLVKKHRAGDYAGAADEFTRWNDHGAGGAIKRRAFEREFYLS